jgi:hypothetical protein
LGAVEVELTASDAELFEDLGQRSGGEPVRALGGPWLFGVALEGGEQFVGADDAAAGEGGLTVGQEEGGEVSSSFSLASSTRTRAALRARSGQVPPAWSAITMRASQVSAARSSSGIVGTALVSWSAWARAQRWS